MSNGFTFKFSERDLSLLAEACVVVADLLQEGRIEPPRGPFDRHDFDEMAVRLDRRLQY